MVMIHTGDSVLEKLQNQTTPTLVFSDLDGTLFASNWRILSAPLYNLQLQRYLQQHAIPFIVVTGRSDWTDIDRQQLRLLGLPSPDVVITANGTIIYYKNRTSYLRDFDWEAKMHYTKVRWETGTIETWNKLAITNRLKEYLLSKNIPYTLGQGNTFLIRIKIHNVSTSSLDVIRKDILSRFLSGIRVMYTEKLLWENTNDIFSGDILITPKTAGKDQAVKYLLEKYAKEYSITNDQYSTTRHSERSEESQSNWIPDRVRDDMLHAVIFGDALVDAGMLSLANTSSYSLEQYAINPTPLLQKAISVAQKTNDHVHMYFGNNPELVLKIMRGEKINERVKGKGLSETVIASETKQSSLSPAQNNPIRKVIRIVEPLLDKLIDQKLSSNEVSFLGLNKLSEGLNQLYAPKTSALEKIKGIYNYSFGNLTDVLDGIRARQSGKKEKNGQLIDGFSDRVKEFMQLFTRAKRRLSSLSESAAADESKGKFSMSSDCKLVLNTLLSALSCTLPSIARAQVEIIGKAVSERDEKGGSMIDRTKKLFMSLFLDTIGAHDKSYSVDQQIYSANIATFRNRLSVTKYSSTSLTEKYLCSLSEQSKSKGLSDFQLKALERWLLYIDVLQQEDVIIKKFLAKHPTLLKQYEKDSQKLAKEYLELPVNKLRKKWKIQDYKLRLKNFIYSL